VDDRAKEEIFANDLIPYEQLIAEDLAPTVMTAHVVFPALDPDQPATLSETIINGILRKKMQYKGVVFSDDLLMKAIADRHDLYDAALQHIRCGGDAVLICKHPEMAQDIVNRFKTELKAHRNDPIYQDVTDKLTQAYARIQQLRQHPQFTALSMPITKQSSDLFAKNHEYIAHLFS
jgi:beta-N-acetylhexosaminidase